MKIKKLNKKNRIDYDDNKFYIGYYDDDAYIIAYDKMCIKNYMEVHRHLMPDEYLIMEDELDNYELMSQIELVVCECEGFYLPERDITIAQSQFLDMNVELERAYKNLTNLVRLIGQIDHCDKERDSLLNAANALANIYNNSKKMEKLNRISFAEHPIIYCDMIDYHRFLQEYEERKLSFNRWYN